MGGALAIMRRDLLESVGGYDESALVNDWELWTRLASITRFANLPEPLYLYRKHDKNLTKARYADLVADWRVIRKRWLERLLGDARLAERLVGQLESLRAGRKLTWRQRRYLRRDLARLIDCLVASRTIDEHDRAALEAEFADLLRSTTPRLWQMLQHWRRHRLGF